MIADASIDEDIVMRGLYDKTLHAQHQATCVRIDERRLQPGAVLFKHVFGERREEFQRVEERRLLLYDRMGMRGAPQSGFAMLMSRMSCRISGGVRGRPPCGRDFQRQ